MKKYGIILAFVVFAVGIGASYHWFGPMSREEAILHVFEDVREADVLSGVALVASQTPTTGPSKEAAPSAMRAAFQLSLPKEEAAGSGQAIFTFINAAAAGVDAYAEVRALSDGRSFLRIDNLPPVDNGKLFGQLDKSWWETDLAMLGGLLLGSEGIFVQEDASVESAKLSEDDIALRWMLVRDMLVSERLYAAGRPAVEFLGGRLMHRVELGFHREVASQLLRTGREALLGRELTTPESEAIDTRLQDASALLTLWIDAGSGRLERMLLEFGTPSGARQTVLITALDLETPVVIEEPSGARSLESVLNAIGTDTAVVTDSASE